MRTTCFLSCVLLSMIAVATAHAGHPRVSFREIVQTADLIFVGTVDRQICRMEDSAPLIVTDVWFRDVTVLHAGGRSVQAGSTQIMLTHAGGVVGNLGLSVSSVPSFSTGRRYVVCALDDGKKYLSPVVGGSQGKFEVVEDASTGRSIVLAAGGRAVTGLREMDIALGDGRTTTRDGVLSGATVSATPQGFLATLPVPAAAGDEVTTAASRTESGERAPAVDVSTFVDYIGAALSSPPPAVKILKLGGQGVWWERRGDSMVAEALPGDRLAERQLPTTPIGGSPARVSVPRAESPSSDLLLSPGGPDVTYGTVLETCGYHNLKIVMEQVATDHVTFTPNHESMWIWNRFMDLFNYSNDDGTYGAFPGNTQNEFVGFITDAKLNSVYGSNWDGALGMTKRWYIPLNECGWTIQSDVMLNAAYSWTNDEKYFYDTPDAWLIRPTVMHELGHVWGLANGYEKELYDYDVPTVMHAIYHLIENGWGIHRSDAYLVRRQYFDQTAVINRIDVGVESYFAQGGLQKSSVTPTTCFWDQSITLANVTVENMSNADVSNVRIRFYLSADRTITTADYSLGSYWEWSTFPMETYSVADYTMRISSTVPAGSYYVGAIVTVNGFGDDEFMQNNATWFMDKVVVQIPPTLAIDVSAVKLGTSRASTPYTSSFAIANAGQAPLTGSVTESAAWITTLTPSTFTLAAGQKITVSLGGAFPATAGVFSTDITVASSAGSQTVQISGISVIDPPGFTRILSAPVGTEADVSVACAWGDLNGDGREDLYVGNNDGNNSLYQNQGSGAFTQVTWGPTVNDGGNSNGVACGDYDNDGDLDIFVAHGNSEKSPLYRNDQGVFVTVSQTAFPAEKTDARGCAWVDYDNDGYLDIFVANYGREGLYKNNGNGTFTGITAGPLVEAGGASRSGSWCDFDNDGDQDLIVTNYYGSNFLFRNEGSGNFTRITSSAIGADTIYNVGASWGDYDNDGLMDLFVTRTNRCRNSLFHNSGGGEFTRVTTGAIANDSLFSEGSCWLDYNNDGYLDLFVARGGPFTSNEVLYRGYGNGTFTKVTGANGEFSDRGMSFGCAAADYDDDGDVDVFVTNASDPFVNYLYSNNGTTNHWVKIRCVGYASNRSAIGAHIIVRAVIGGTPVQQSREISGQTGSRGQSSLVAHVGLGSATVIDEITVRWPSGAVQSLTSQPVDRLITIEEESAHPPPLQVTALNGYRNTVPLVWRPPAGAAAQAVRSYTLRRFTQGGSLSSMTGNITHPYYRDESATPGETFVYKAYADYDGAQSAASNEVQVLVPASGYSISSAGATAVPKLDGVIAPGEWSGAATADVTLPGYAGQVTLFAMNSANMLFLAIDDKRDTQLDSNDTFGFFIDGNGDREWPQSSPSPEGLLQLYQGGSTGTALNAFLGVRGQWPGSMAADAWRTPAGVLQRISASMGHVQYEGSIDLNTSILRAMPGDTLGGLVYVWDGGTSGFTGTWPQETVTKLSAFCSGYAWGYAPFSYGDVTLGASSTVAVSVTFTVTVPEGTPSTERVFLTGDFNLWDPGSATLGADGYHHDLCMTQSGPRQWSLTLPFKRGESIEYKYTRGAWASVEKGPQGEEIANRKLTMPDTSLECHDQVERWADIVGSAVRLLSGVPEVFFLAQNYPNPFNPSTIVRCGVPVRTSLTISIYSVLGQHLEDLHTGEIDAGYYEFTFDASRFPSGLYLCRMTAGEHTSTCKMLLMR